MTDHLYLPSAEAIKQTLRIDKEKLPSFPQAAARLLEVSKDDQATLADISKIVETDPGISVRVLEMVNSAYYGLQRKITALSEAVMFLGLDEIKKLAFGMTTFEKLFKSGRAEKFDRLLFWRHCISTAVLSMEIARQVQYPEPEEAYIAGLLHDVGKVLLDVQGRTDYGDFIQDLADSNEPAIEMEKDRLGLGHDDVGAFFCSLWKLPEELSLVVRYHHQPFDHLDLSRNQKMLIAIVSLSDFLCWTQGIGSFDMIRPPVLAPEIEKLLTPDRIDLIHCIHHMSREVDNISRFYRFVFPSPTQLRENLLWTNLKLSRADTRYYYGKDPLAGFSARAASGGRAPESGIALGKPLARARTIKEVLDIVMYQVGLVFEPLHWSILLKDPKTGDMTFSVVVGTNRDKLLGAKLPKGEGIVGHIMATGRSVIVEDVEKDSRFSSRIDRHTGFKTHSIIGTPLKTEDRIFGVIELINTISERSFTEEDLSILSAIAEYAAIAIERAYYYQTLTAAATKDALTGLKNRWSFDRAVGNPDEVQKRYGSIFSLMTIAVTGLEKLAGTSGEPGCESALKTLAQILNTTKRRQDDLYRYGEETFILLLPMTYAEDAEMALHRLMNAVSSTLDQKGSPLQVQIRTYTLGAEDFANLKTLIRGALSGSKPLADENRAQDIETSLQSMVEKESKRDRAAGSKSQTFGKAVSLNGDYTRLKTRESGSIRVERLSLTAAGFRIAPAGRLEVNDFLDIRFTLDNLQKTSVKRRAVVREIQSGYILADFYNPPPYSKDLGFYLMS